MTSGPASPFAEAEISEYAIHPIALYDASLGEEALDKFRASVQASLGDGWIPADFRASLGTSYANWGDELIDDPAALCEFRASLGEGWMSDDVSIGKVDGDLKEVAFPDGLVPLKEICNVGYLDSMIGGILSGSQAGGIRGVFARTIDAPRLNQYAVFFKSSICLVYERRSKRAPADHVLDWVRGDKRDLIRKLEEGLNADFWRMLGRILSLDRDGMMTPYQRMVRADRNTGYTFAFSVLRIAGENAGPETFERGWDSDHLDIAPKCFFDRSRDAVVSDLNDAALAAPGSHGRAWLWADWSTVILMVWDREYLPVEPGGPIGSKPAWSAPALLAQEIAVQDIWHAIDSATDHIIELNDESDEREAAVGMSLLRELANLNLRVKDWDPNATLDQLRLTSRLDSRIEAYIEAAEAYSRYQRLTREERVASQMRAFQQRAAGVGAILGALVLGEVTISVSDSDGDGDGTKSIVAGVVGLMGFGTALWTSRWVFEAISRRVLAFTVGCGVLAALLGSFFWITSDLALASALPLGLTVGGAVFGIALTFSRAKEGAKVGAFFRRVKALVPRRGSRGDRVKEGQGDTT